jgi:hypothetical protein
LGYPPPLTDEQVGAIVAGNFVSAIARYMSSAPESMDFGPDNELAAIPPSPVKDAVLRDMAQMTASHDSRLGNIAGSVERGPNQEITGFTFEKPARERAYSAEIDQAVRDGVGTKEQAAKKIGQWDRDRFTGTYHVDSKYVDPGAP